MRSGKRHREAVAATTAGSFHGIKGGKESAIRTSSSKTLRLCPLPVHQDAWLMAIENYNCDALANVEAAGLTAA